MALLEIAPVSEAVQILPRLYPRSHCSISLILDKRGFAIVIELRPCTSVAVLNPSWQDASQAFQGSANFRECCVGITFVEVFRYLSSSRWSQPWRVLGVLDVKEEGAGSTWAARSCNTGSGRLW